MLRGVNQGHQVVSQLSQHTALEYFGYYTQKRNWTIVFNVGDINFFMNRDDVRELPFLWLETMFE